MKKPQLSLETHYQLPRFSPIYLAIVAVLSLGGAVNVVSEETLPRGVWMLLIAALMGALYVYWRHLVKKEIEAFPLQNGE